MSRLIRIFTVCLVNLFFIPIVKIWNKQRRCPNLADRPNLPDFTLIYPLFSSLFTGSSWWKGTFFNNAYRVSYIHETWHKGCFQTKISKVFISYQLWSYFDKLIATGFQQLKQFDWLVYLDHLLNMVYPKPPWVNLVKKWAPKWDFQHCGILTCVDSDEHVQPPLSLEAPNKWCSGSSLTPIEFSSD